MFKNLKRTMAKGLAISAIVASLGSQCVFAAETTQANVVNCENVLFGMSLNSVIDYSKVGCPQIDSSFKVYTEYGEEFTLMTYFGISK